MKTTQAFGHVMANEQSLLRREAERRLAEEVRNLMCHDEQEGLHWQGTSIDLMEALHVAYSTGELQDDQGVCLSFTLIVNRVCRVLHVPRPSNPYECASRGRRRKGLQMCSYMNRYQRLLKRELANPIWLSIGRA